MSKELQRTFDRQGAQWRDPGQIVAQWEHIDASDGALLAYEATSGFWDALAAARATLIVSREYEHLLLALSASPRPRVSYLRLPHPSGVAYDPAGRLYVASTRNPNQLYAFLPATALSRRAEGPPGRPRLGDRPLIPERTWYLPGCAYLHDLALIAGTLHANAVGQNVVVAFRDGVPRPVWWPRAVERAGAPRTDRNYLQLNSIAAGASLRSSYFSASGERPGRVRPGHAAYPVDRRGVVFSGRTREPVVRGLTRPHSARLHERRLWIANSGYGELVVARGGRPETVARLPGWTRGLGFAGGVAFVGTSRVIPRFRQYAPGLDLDASACAVHAVDVVGGTVLGTIAFPAGNQIFAIEPVPAAWTRGFPFDADRPDAAAAQRLFYAFSTAR